MAVTIFTLSSAVRAATYYVDFSAGSDTNAGTSAGAPWKRHPYMQGWTGSYSHAAGDRFIFKGGVTWPNACFPLTISTRGSSGAFDYYGVDATWFSADSWTRPIFSAGGSAVSGNNVMVPISREADHIIFDNIEFSGFYWNTASWQASSVFTTGNASYLILQNLLIHNWSFSGSNDTYMIQGAGGSAPYGLGSYISNCVISASSTNNGGGAIGASVPLVVNCTVSNVTQGVLLACSDSSKPTLMVLGCNIGPVVNSFEGATTWHPNGIENFPLAGQVQIIASNFIHDCFGITCYAAGSSSNQTVYYINNVFWNPGGPNPPITTDCNVGQTNFYYNNTFVLPSGMSAVRFANHGVGTVMDRVVFENNHVINDGSTAVLMLDKGVTITSLITDHNLISTASQATSAGYRFSNLYAPTKARGPTVDQGVNKASLYITDILGVSRPQGSAWDIGAYEYPSVGTSMSPAPNLHIVGVGP